MLSASIRTEHDAGVLYERLVGGKPRRTLEPKTELSSGEAGGWDKSDEFEMKKE